jgi:hypothetical protein
MVYITLDKTWNAITYVVNNDIYTTDVVQMKQALYLLKEAFVTAGWIVTQSSDSVNVGGSGNLPADRWTDYSKLIYAANPTAHSWIVLKNTVIGPDFSVCFDYNSSSWNTIAITVASGGYQNGTIQNRPVVNANCLEHTYANFYYSNTGTSANRGFAILYSSDGECIRVFSSYSGTGLNYVVDSGYILLFEKLKNPASWLGYNYVFIAKECNTGTSALGFSYSNLCIATTLSGRSEKNTVPLYVGIATLGLGTNGALGNSTSGKSFSDADGHYMLTECYAVSNSTSYSGVLGQFYDMYFAGANIPEGIYLPTDTDVCGLVKFGQGVFGCSGNKISIP